MKFLKMFSLTAAVSLIFAASNNAVADPAESRAGPFRLAKTDAAFYLGYEKSVSLMRGAQAVPIQREVRKTLDGTVAMTAARLSTLDAASSTPSFNFAHNIERLEIGNVKKTENLRTFSAVNTGVQAFADLTWGDTLWVVPTTAAGAYVQTLNIAIDRSVTGAGEASAMAHYDVLSKTYVNGLEVPLLTYAIVKAPGGLDQILGQAVMRSEVAVQVGRRFTMEAVSPSWTDWPRAASRPAANTSGMLLTARVTPSLSSQAWVCACAQPVESSNQATANNKLTAALRFEALRL